MDIVVYSGPRSAALLVERMLGTHFDVRAVDPVPEQVLPALTDAVAFLDASMKVPITAEAIAAAPKLRLVVTATTGASHIDVAALDTRGIPLLTLKGQTEVLRSLTPAAELSWLLLMACARRLRGAIHHVEQGGWERTEFPGAMLKGSTLGIVGLGRLGGWMARYARAFDMDVVAFDPLVTEAPEGVRLASLAEVLRASDFVSLHVHLSDETVGMIDATAIASMKPGAVLVNTSRGELVDEGALVAALESGHLAAVGADVLTGEPDPSASAWWRYAREHDEVVITPHIGGFSPAAVERVVEFSCGRILEFFEAT